MFSYNIMSMLENKPDYRWQDDAICRGVPLNLFFPERGEPVTSVIKDLCTECPVRTDCLEYALHHERYGVWGGLTEDQRQKIRRERNIVVVTPESFYNNTTVARQQEIVRLTVAWRKKTSFYI